MTNDNSAQIEFWNGEHGDSWARHADAVDAMFSELTEAVLGAADVGVADRVLDIGCGNGGTTIEAAARATPMGAVTAVDVSGPMIEVAQERADAAGLVNVTFIMGDAALYPFADGSFDAVISRLGVMFFEDPEDAFARIAPALASDGRVALGVWREPRENPWAMAPVSAARPFIDMPPRPGPEDPGPFSLADPDRVSRILGGAGFRDTALAPFDFRIPLGATIDDALAFVLEMGPLSQPLAAATGEGREKALAAIREVLTDNRDADGIVRLDGACWIVTAAAP